MRLQSEWVNNKLNDTLSCTKRLSGTYNGGMNVDMIARSKCCDCQGLKSSLLVLAHFGHYFGDIIFFQQELYSSHTPNNILFVIFCVSCFSTCGCSLLKDEKMNLILTVIIKLTIRLEMEGQQKTDQTSWAAPLKLTNSHIISYLLNPYKIRSVKISSCSFLQDFVWNCFLARSGSFLKLWILAELFPWWSKTFL